MKKIALIILIACSLIGKAQTVRMVKINTSEKQIVVHYVRPNISEDTFKVDTTGIIHTTYDAFITVCKGLSLQPIKSIHLQNIAATINGKLYPRRFEIKWADKTSQQFIVANLATVQQKAFNDLINECQIIIPIKPTAPNTHLH